MTEIEKAKLLAASLKLARKEVDSLRVEFEDQMLDFIRTGVVESMEPVQGAKGEKGDKGDKGDPGPERRIIIEHKGPKGDTGDEGRGVVSAYIEENNLYIRFSDEEVAHIGEIATLQGEQGIQGIQGIQGEKGEKGDKGDRGEKGERGDTGEKGDRGDQGEKGDRGDQGIQGEQGVKGDTGLRGEKGEQGEKGDQGERGPVGAQGVKGDKGDKGDRGEKGEQGEPGAPGQDAEEVDVEAITKELKEDLEKFKAVISAEINSKKTQAMFAGGGSGEVNLARLDDVDPSALVNDKVLRYNATTGKFEGATVLTEGGAGSGDVSNTYLQATFVTNTAFQSFVANTNQYIASTAGTGEVSNADFQAFIANTNQAIADRLQVANASNFLVQSDVNQYLQVANASNFLVQSDVNQYLQVANVASNTSTSNATLSGTTATFTRSDSSTFTLDLSSLSTDGGTATATENLRLNFPKSANNVANDVYVALALDSTGSEIVADCTNANHVSRVVGIRAANGDVISTGILENSGWSWASNSTIYVGSSINPSGANNLTTLPSVDGAFFSLPVGIALSSTKIFVRVGTSVVLGS